MTFWETIQRGEYVMFALALLFIAVILIWAIRGARLHSQTKSYYPLMQRIRDHVVEGDLENARQVCESAATPGARVVESGLGQIGQPMREVRETMSETSRIEGYSLEKGTLWLRLIGVVAPLLGLGGTLVGVRDRLRDLGESEIPATVSMVSANIAPTIVTTVAGLGVGIFSLFALACLASQIKGAKRSLETLSQNFQTLLNEPS